MIKKKKISCILGHQNISGLKVEKKRKKTENRFWHIIIYLFILSHFAKEAKPARPPPPNSPQHQEHWEENSP